MVCNVAVFAYRRHQHIRRIIETIPGDAIITVYIDCPVKMGDIIGHDEVLETLETIEREMRVVQRDEHLGLRASLLAGITEQLSLCDHVIVLEDDCIPSDGFFDFMERSLIEHVDDPNILSVCAMRSSVRFNPWGWATWRDKWSFRELHEYERVISQAPEWLQELYEQAVFNGRQQNIWSMNWLLEHHLQDAHAVFPDENLIENVGRDGSGVNACDVYTKWLEASV